MEMSTAHSHVGRPSGRWLGMLARFRRDRRGGVLIEMLAALPVLSLLLLGSVDMARYLLVHQKLNRASSTMADLISQSSSITLAEVDQLFPAAERLLEPFDLQNDGLVIVSSISRAEGNDEPEIDWQREGGGSYAATSRIGDPGGPAEMPDSLLVREGENLIVAEVFFDYQPLFFSGIVEGGLIWQRSFRRTRLGALSTIN